MKASLFFYFKLNFKNNRWRKNYRNSHFKFRLRHFPLFCLIKNMFIKLHFAYSNPCGKYNIIKRWSACIWFDKVCLTKVNSFSIKYSLYIHFCIPCTENFMCFFGNQFYFILSTL